MLRAPIEGDRPLGRRLFLSAALVGLTAKGERRVTGSFFEDGLPRGHALRDRKPFQRPAQNQRVPVVIVGGGIAGLSAAWRLQKKGFNDFVVLELEATAGGNARSGENEVSPYPWAAHYVPVPNAESKLVRELFQDLGVMQDGRCDERFLCFAPQERLFLHGRWQEGLEPEIAATQKDREQYRRFNNLIQEFRATRQFTIPMEIGARSSALDRLSMAAWLDAEKLDSPYLRWYADYACRDDYGARAASTSAWAGIHYFASREHEDKGPVTWPEGNGWIVRALMKWIGPHVKTGSPVYAIKRAGTKYRVLTETTEYNADAVIFAAPTFLAPYIVEDAPPVHGFVYSPWITANLTLDRLPRERGSEPAWDNVIFDSPALGYVVATHMSLRTRIDRTVWTWYWALADGEPARNRTMMLNKDWKSMTEFILNDLERPHPDIRQCVSRIDVLRIGHAMARPVPGFLSSQDRLKWAAPHGRVLYANSDLSGFSIFEEAQYRGVRAADRALTLLG
jgi:glycine/D-amino acid oxidase-like deaminating enzyme